MSKREFIRNTRRAIINGTLSDDLAGHFYDNIYLIGHVARSAAAAHQNKNQNYLRHTKINPGYLLVQTFYFFLSFKKQELLLFF